MAGINDCSNANLEGKRAALDLSNAQGQDFSQKCWNIDNHLKGTSAQYQNDFMSSMNSELETRNLLPKVELNMVQQSSDETLQILQNRHKHIDTQDLVRAEDNLRGNGQGVESNLVHTLINKQDDIQGTHAERNFWGKNHSGIDMDRLNRWANNSRPDTYAIAGDYAELRSNGQSNRPEAPPVKPHEADPKPFADKPFQSKPSRDDAQDHEIKSLKDRMTQNELDAKIKAGVVKDAHHTVIGGETLTDMACLALHKAGVNHMSPRMVQHEAEKIRMINGLGRGEHLPQGMSLMLRTNEEVEHETARRIAAYEKTHPAQMLNGFTINETPTHSGTEYKPHVHRRQDVISTVNTTQNPDDLYQWNN